MYEITQEQAEALLMRPVTTEPGEDWVECRCGAGASFCGPADDALLDELICDECFGDLLDQLNGGPDWCFNGDFLDHESFDRESAALGIAVLALLSPLPPPSGPQP